MISENSPLFGFLGDSLTKLVEEFVKNTTLGESEIPDAISPVFESFIEELTPSIAVLLLKGSKTMLREQRKAQSGFEKRNLIRWQSSFSRLELISHISAEIGQEFNYRYRQNAADTKDLLSEALISLNGRGLLIAAEAIHLMKGGFAEGALTRWRALHEVLVVSMFISKKGQVAAERYLQSAHFQSLSAAKQLSEFEDRSGIAPMPEKEVKELSDLCDVLTEKYGPDIKKGFGWAKPFMNQSKPATFRDLEEAVGLDHWRPRYKWSSQHTHAGSRYTHSNLGLAESDKPLILVGPSNSGMVDPVHMVALHLWSLSSVLLLSKEGLEEVILSNALHLLVADIGEISIAEEKATLAAALVPTLTS